MLGNVLGTVEVEMNQAIVPIFEDLMVSGETDTQAHSMRGMRKHSKRSTEVCRRNSQCTGPPGEGQVCSVRSVTVASLVGTLSEGTFSSNRGQGGELGRVS